MSRVRVTAMKPKTLMKPPQRKKAPASFEERFVSLLLAVEVSEMDV